MSSLTLHHVHFDAAGDFVDRPALDAALAGAGPVTDVFVVSHGWNNSFADARQSYAELAAHMTAVADEQNLRPEGFAALVLGVVWPSKAWDESGAALRDEGAGLAATVPETLSPVRTSPAEYVHDVARLQTYLLRDRLSPGERKQFDDLLRRYTEPAAGAEEFSAFDAGFAPEAALLPDVSVRDVYRAFTYWQMKKRAGVVGGNGVHELVRAAQRALPAARFHLVGHSFGCKVVLAAIAQADKPPERPVQTVVLLQGAVSHEALAARVTDQEVPGGYRLARTPERVEGVIAATHSKLDRQLNWYYPLGSRLGGHTGELEAFRVVPFKYSALGAVGAYNAGQPMGRRGVLGPVGEAYGFAAGDLWCLDGGPPDDRIPGHSAVRTREVAWLIWSAVLRR